MVRSLLTPMSFDEPLSFQTYDYPIGGKMVVGKATLSSSYEQLMMTDYDAKQQLKDHLLKEMVDYMLQHKLCEFTQMEDPITGGKRVYVRAYLAPDEQIKILRVARKL